MKIITNNRQIQRYKKVGSITTVTSLVILAAGLFLSLKQDLFAQYYLYSYLALIIGFVLSQFGIFYGNRYGKSPRPDESLNASLKGLEDRFTLYHYEGPSTHFLAGPSGLWVLLPYKQVGTITYEKARWRQKGGNLYWKLFAQESLGRPDRDAKYALEDAQKFFKQKLPDKTLPEINAVLVFINDKAIVKVTDAPIPTLHADKLKDFIRRKAKETNLPPEAVQPVIEILPKV